MKHIVLILVVLSVLLTGCGTTDLKDEQSDSVQKVAEMGSERYCESSTATWQHIEISNGEGRFMICGFSSIVIEHPPGCDLPDLYCVIGVGQDGISCVEME